MGGAAPPHSGNRAWTRPLVAALAACAALGLLLATVVVGWPEVFAGLLRTQVEARLTTATGRPVTVATAHLAWVGGLRVRLGGVALASPVEPAPPLTVESAAFTLDWETLLASGATRWDVHDVVVDAPRLRLGRRHDGKVVGEDLLQRLRALLARQAGSLDLRVTGVKVHGGAVEIVDGALDQPARLQGISLVVDQVAAGKPTSITLEARLDDDGKPALIHLQATSSSLPPDLASLDVPPLDVAMHVEGLDVAPWAVLLPVDMVQPAAGILSLDLTAHCSAHLQEAHVDGNIRVDGLRLALKGNPGAAANVQVTVDGDVDLQASQLRVRRMDVAAAGFHVVERLTASWAPVPRVADLHLELAADARAFSSFLPPGTLPPELSVDGNVSILATARDNNGELAVELEKAHVKWADTLDKKAGTALNLTLRTQTDGTALDVTLFRLQLDAATLTGSARMDLARGTLERADLDTGTLALSSLRNVMPSVAAASRRRDSGGFFRVRTNGEPGTWTGTVQADGVRVTLPLLRAQGSGVAEGRLFKDSRGWAAEAQVNLTDLALQHTNSDGETLVDKPRGTRLQAFLAGNLQGPLLEVDRLVLEVGGSSALLRGTVRGLGTAHWSVDAHASSSKLLAEDLGSVVPMVRGWPLQAEAEGRARFHVVAGQEHAAWVDVEAFSMRHQRSRAAGTLRLDGWPRPHLRGELTSFTLEAEDLRPWWPAGWPSVGDASARGQLLLDGRAGEPENASLTWSHGEVHALGQDLEVQAVVRNLARPRVALKLRCETVDVAALQRLAGSGGAGRPAEPLPFRKVRKALAPVVLTAEFEVGTLPLPDATLTGVTGHLMLKDGVITLNPLRANALGGVVELDSSTIDVLDDELRARLRVTVTDADTGAVLNRKARVVDGTMSAVADLSLHGADAAQWLKTAQGPVAYRFKSFTVYNLDLMGSLELPGGAQNPLTGRPREIPPTILYDGNGTGDLKEGRLTFTRTLDTRTSFGFLSVDGWVDLDGYTYLVGMAEVSPEWVEHETRGGYRPRSGARTPVRITGMPGELVIHDVNARVFIKDEEVPNLLEGAGRLAKDAREQLARRAAEEVAGFRKRVEEDRRAIRQDVQHTLEELRANWPQWMAPAPDAGPQPTVP